MFNRLHEVAHTVSLTINGDAVTAMPGDTVAAVLLEQGIQTFRITDKSAMPRGPYCGMGICFDCLVSIDGDGSRQACLTRVRDGMIVETGRRRRNLENEVQR